MLRMLTWATGGMKWRAYVVALLVVALALYKVIAAIRKTERDRVHALNQAQTLATVAERIAGNDEIRRLSPDARRERLRKWGVD